MNFLNNQARPRTAHLRAPTHELTLVPIEAERAEEDPCAEEFSRCGWFDSSLELAAGLQVTEFVDALPDGLPFEAVH